MKKRKLFGVIAAAAADTEQREVIKGIIEKTREMDIDIAVISNIYNPMEWASMLKTENLIYDLVHSDEYDGIILISESVIYPDVQKKMLEELQNKSAPVITIGALPEGFSLPTFTCINTDDVNDFKDICDHLTDVHGFTDIHILTGYSELELSHKRVEGYRRSLEEHGIPYDESKVFYGNFWNNSGYDHAMRYISGELPYPQALICGNDYMAYGLLDCFLEHNIDITKKMAVTGYEYIRERYCHVPILTTYQRNRKALGIKAVEMLCKGADNITHDDFAPPKGNIISGDTCPCGAKTEDIRYDIRTARKKDIYDRLDLYSLLEHKLIECRSVEKFVETCREEKFRIKNADRLYMCLYENWYEGTGNSSNMVCYDLIDNTEPFMFNKYNISAVFGNEAASYYFCPLFFADRELGYIVLRFKGNDSFGHIFRCWLKTIANGLEFLRMKNDIRFYLQCQDISEERDTLTGMLNENGLKKAYRNTEKDGLSFVAIRIAPGICNCGVGHKEHIDAVLDAAEAVRQFSDGQICSRINEDTFVCLIRDMTDNTDLLAVQLSALLQHNTSYIKKYGLDSFVCTAVPCEDNDYLTTKEKCFARMTEMTDVYSARRTDPHYKKLNALRTMIYSTPQITFDQREIYSHFNGSDGYLRTIFRKCYGFTLHDDCTNARISAARYLITMSKLSNSEIAEKCGYNDPKYFMRQFSGITGYTVPRYRLLFSRSAEE